MKPACMPQTYPILTYASEYGNMLPPFTTLIVTYNSESVISNLLADLRQYSPASFNRVIVIDNASQDKTVDIIRSNFPEVQWVMNNKNVGYAKAVNQGVSLCMTEYVLLLNPDIRISNPRLFSAMLACLEQSPQVAVVAPLQFKQSGNGYRLNFTWSYWNLETIHLYLFQLLYSRSHVYKPVPVTFLNAGCLLIRKSSFDRVGKLNEKYFLYGEEPDLFLKLKRYGYESRLLPSIEVVHYREQSMKTVPTFRRLQLRIQGLYNIGEALVHGYFQLILVTLSKNMTKIDSSRFNRSPSKTGDFSADS
jgi:N-acetylglucosaminyl-diphospho-decaprenol L-rhamnosyltransferase